MCNINILIKSDRSSGNNLMDIYTFLTGVTTLSFSKNKDGEGVFCDSGILIKSKSKIDYRLLLNEIGSSNFILSHQRYTTSGYGEEYTHPFESKDFIMVHNGVMSGFCKDGHSDTYGLFEMIKKEFNKTKGNREKRIIKTIDSVFYDEDGTWSVAIYDKKAKILYYFKDGATNMSMVRSIDRSVMYLSTSPDNLNLLPILRKEFKEYSIKSYTIYRFNLSGEKVSFKIVGRVNKDKKHKKNITYGGINYCGNRDYISDYDNYRDYRDGANSFFREGDEIVNINATNNMKSELMIENCEYDYCDTCGKMTNNFVPYMCEMMCDGCLDERYTEVREKLNKTVI